MPDRERVVKAWNIFRDSNPYEICSGREFRAIREPEYCMGQMIEDTIALLKEQEAVEPILKREGQNKYYSYYVCPRCDDEVVYDQNYCSECGVPFMWEGR